MAKNVALKPHTLFVGALYFTWGANSLAAYTLHFPFVYCWVGPVAAQVYIAWGMVALYIAVAYCLVQFMRGNLPHVFVAVMAIAAIMELPKLGAYLFNVGGSCG